MWLLETLRVPHDAGGGMLAFWVAGAVVALTAVMFLFALIRTGIVGATASTALIVALAFGGLAAWSWTDHVRALGQRAVADGMAALDRQALAPGSVLGCLTGADSDVLNTACETAVFASAEAAAAAVTYTAAQLDLLADAQALARTRGTALDSRVAGLRRSLEHDRFGLVSHLLAARTGCTPERCEALRLFRDSARLRANLRTDAFGAHLARASEKWQRGAPAYTGTPTARTPEAGREHASGPGAPLPPNYKLPSADSIPAVSIMTVEPGPAPAAAPSPPPAAAASPPSPPPRPTRQRPAQERPAPNAPARGAPLNLQ